MYRSLPEATQVVSPGALVDEPLVSIRTTLCLREGAYPRSDVPVSARVTAVRQGPSFVCPNALIYHLV